MAKLTGRQEEMLVELREGARVFEGEEKASEALLAEGLVRRWGSAGIELTAEGHEVAEPLAIAESSSE